MTPQQARRGDAAALAVRSLQFVAPFRRPIAGILALALISAALGAGEPLALKILVDELGGGGATRAFWLALGGLVALEIGRTVLGGWLGVLTWDVRLGVDFVVREQVIAKLNALPISYHQQETVGGTMTKVNQGIGGFVTAFAELAFNILPTIVYLVLSIAAMAKLDWRLSLVVLLFTPIPPLVGAWAAREQTQRERLLMERWTRLYGRLNEVLAGILTVKGFGMEDAERRRFLHGQQEGNDIVRRGTRTDTRTGALRGLAITAARIAAIAVGGILVARGDITVGTLLAFLGYIGGLFGPVQGLTNVYQTTRKATVSLEIIFDILDRTNACDDVPGARDLGPVRGDIRFRDVTFAYREGEPVIHGLDLHIRPGETTAFVGPSGSGKTTLISLLQRLHPVTDGAIEIDGADIRTVTRTSLRQQIGVVFQDVHLFNDTVRANLAYGRPWASDEEIEAAARAANAHEFIAQLPEGYETIVGERGSRLSGGQRQRLAIARALLKDPPILVLDEATAALDAETEQKIQEALRRLTRGRTTIIIAHRLSTVVDADRIVVLRDGRIQAIGRHDELMAEGGYYASLVARQTQGVLWAA